MRQNPNIFQSNSNIFNIQTASHITEESGERIKARGIRKFKG